VQRVASWIALGAATAGAGWALGRLGIPSAYLFASLLLGIAVALRWPGRLAVGPASFGGAQAVTGVVLGTYLQSSALEALGRDWLPVALVSAATLAVTLAAGAVLARTTEVDEPTAALGMIAGGASGIVAMSRELGGDDRLVAFMQYVRVLVIVLLTPLLVAVFWPGHGLGGGAVHEAPLGELRGWWVTPLAAVAGVVLGRATRLPAGTLLGPLLVAAAITLGVPGGGFEVPPLLREIGFVLIGWQVGLRFTVETIRAAGRLLAPVLAAIAALLAACFGLAAALAATTSASLLDAYLATTPGGLYAVLAAAVGAGANTTFIVAVQGLRLLVMVLLAPLAVRLIAGSRATPTDGASRTFEPAPTTPTD
jgi:membrane AbrB-like protein